jgi:D-amino-acid oxidase
MTDVLVIGAGVSGLTTAVRLAEAGLTVRLIAAHPPGDTTSAVAGACWGPDLVDDPRAPRWSTMTRRVFESLAEDPTSGVHLASGMQALPYPAVEPPGWVTTAPGFHLCTPAELPAGYLSGWRYSAPLIDMPRYLAYLVERLARAGVAVEARTITTFEEVAGEAAVLINCTGLGASHLVPDDSLVPTRGQLVIVDNPGITDFFIEVSDDANMTYFFPHGEHVVLGGTAVTGSTDLAPDLVTGAEIVMRCAKIEPRLLEATVRGHLVGLRPTRPRPHVAADAVHDVPLIHNYGHGGGGVTVSWGCADSVFALLR